MERDDIAREIMAMIREEPDLYRPGVHFKDITPLLRNPECVRKVVECFVDEYKDKKIDVVASPGARGFIFGSALAIGLGAGFVPVETQGRGPYKTIKHRYKLEYANRVETLEVHEDAIRPGEKVLIFDDVIGSGKGAEAVAELIKKVGGEIVGFAFLVELTNLKGREKLKGYEVKSLVKY